MDTDTQESKQAKQRASVKWILSKAFNNRVPDNLRDPFYKDHDGLEHLKPQIVVGLGNASLYCQVLSNIYSDPNYQSLNHWSILQTLSRKGVQLNESDLPLTETVLIQTNPLRINAHMSVIEALMVLYAKEVASSGRISSALERISGGNLPTGSNYETSLLLWISHVCSSLKKRIDQEVVNGAVDENGQRLQVPDMPPVRDYRDLCDGVCLAYLISYYCPKVVPWTAVKINYLPTVEDSIHNVLLVSNFSQRNLPYSVFHMTPEDITYMRGTLKQNLIVLLADLFNLFELHPAKCVFYPGMEAQADHDTSGLNEHGIAHRRGVTCHPISPIPDLRSGFDSPTNSTSYKPPFQVNRSPSASSVRRHNTPPRELQQEAAQPYAADEGFVVHKSRGVPTLSSLNEPLTPARLRQAKEKTNIDSKSEERGDNVAAGRPSNWEEQRRPSFAGRRSRRNSFTEESQLTIENFGGSQDQLNMIGRTMERDRDRERKISNTQVIEQLVATRSSYQDARGTIQLGFDVDSGSEKQDKDNEKTTPLKRQSSMSNVTLNNIIHSKEKDSTDGDMSRIYSKSPSLYASSSVDDNDIPKRKTSFTAAPQQIQSNTTTWQQQAINLQHIENEDEVQPSVDSSKLSTIRLKLEEKRRHIEQEKRRMEAAMAKQLQKVGKAAFLQAINKGKTGTPEDTKKDTLPTSTISDDKPARPCSLKDLSNDNTIESKWDIHIESKKTPDIENMNLEQYQQSIAMMNTNLHDIQVDIQRLANQQNQIQAQTMQAQQLYQAQQIANILHQQYGSQQNIPAGYRSINQSFGSSPHLSQNQSSPSNYALRSGNREQLFQQQQQQQQHQHQYVNDQGQYIVTANNQPQQQPHHQNNYSRENSQTHLLGNDGPSRIRDQYSSNQYINREQQYFQDTNHYRDQYSQLESNQYQSPVKSQQQTQQSQQHNQFFLHENNNMQQQQQQQQQPTQTPQRRTWAQSVASNTNLNSNNNNNQIPLDINAWSQNAPTSTPQKIDTRTWKSPNQSSGFSLHQNGNSGSMSAVNDYDQPQQAQNLFQVQSSPQHSRVHKQISQIINNSGSSSDMRNNSEYRDNRMPMSPPVDDMAPQSISFIGDEETGDIEVNTSKNVRPSQQFVIHHNNNVNNSRPNLSALQQQQQQQHHQNNDLDLHLSKLNITSGNRTYRIPSPTRPVLNSNSFQDPQDEANEKGFYISFDNEPPKRPKPPLRMKRSPKKEKNLDEKGDQIKQLGQELEREKLMQNNKSPSTTNMSYNEYNNDEPVSIRKSIFESHTGPSKRDMHDDDQQYIDRRHYEDVSNHSASSHLNNNNNNNFYNQNQSNNINSTSNSRENKALVIGAELQALDPNSVDEMERKKEKIMLLSLQRRQQQEETKARKEIEAMQKRERDREKEDERARKKEEQAARRQAILEQHKLKKAVEEAEREGKTIDKSDYQRYLQNQQNNQAAAKLRPQKQIRQRPKTIHVESGSIDLSEASSLASRGKRGSSSNLTGIGLQNTNSMRRDYYRGSQDSLAIRESPDEYPSTNSSTPVGRRGSYNKTGREPPPPPTLERGRTLSRISLSKGANFRGRKSNSLMNLCDSDSGLGRATPPRRAPSPGMGPSGRHLPSPSGPGSLPPGLMTKRRVFDDGSSDISSAASSMMDYNGPRLYKQPATKSNRGIILNAVEYCVFPGAVNRDAKQKVLEKIARSEAKHFLVLFRDAGCQFRALYSYWPESETIVKLYGTGPTQVDDVMFDKFFKYNSGGKRFAQVHTKHLTVTIDAFTIHNSLWQGKRVNLPSKKDMALVI